MLFRSYRLHEETIEQPGWDFVIVARTNAKGASYQEISEALEHLLKQQKLLSKNS